MNGVWKGEEHHDRASLLPVLSLVDVARLSLHQGTGLRYQTILFYALDMIQEPLVDKFCICLPSVRRLVDGLKMRDPLESRVQRKLLWTTVVVSAPLQPLRPETIKTLSSPSEISYNPRSPLVQ